MSGPLRAAIVTGAASGIGRACTLLLAARGWDVLAVDRDSAGLDHLDGADSSTGGRIVGATFDLSEDAAHALIVERALEAFGRIDGVVHCAGFVIPGPIDSVSVEDLDRQLNVNTRAPYLLTQQALAHLGTAGRIVFISSNAALKGYPQTTAYAMSKAALLGLSRTLAVELGPRGITVNAIAPGTIDTPANKELLNDPAVREELIAGIPAGRLGSAEDVAEGVAYLLSDAAAHVSGTILNIDGAETAA